MVAPDRAVGVPEIWAVISTAVAAGLCIFHFANPYPLLQIPDWGHRLFAVPGKQEEELILHLFRQAGLAPFGTFTAGVRQTLLRDGLTVIALGEGLQKAAVSPPCNDPVAEAQRGRALLAAGGVETEIWTPPETELAGSLVVLKLPAAFGWDVAYRLPGRDMPRPKWEGEKH
jgi:hypothetical protein